MSKESIRLNRFLAMSGLGSRRECDKLIQKGSVAVNGEVETNPAVKINPEDDEIFFQGNRIQSEVDYHYYLLNKPAQVITTTNDPYGRKTVLDLIPKHERVYPVGRLDYNTTGALLLTNDGDLAYHLTHPKFQIPKIYRVRVLGQVEEKSLKQLELGIKIDDIHSAKGELVTFSYSEKHTDVQLILREGRKREIKRMFLALGHRVVRLHRSSFAFLTVDDLPLGKWRQLNSSEVQELKDLTNGY